MGPRRSVVFRWFTDPEARRIHPDDEHPEVSRGHVAGLRAVHGAPREDPEAEELLALLLERSAEFAELWERHEVPSRSGSIKRFLNPLVGTLALDCQILVGENATERLVVFAPAAGSEDTVKLDLLAVVGTQQFDGAPAVERG